MNKYLKAYMLFSCFIIAGCLQNSSEHRNLNNTDIISRTDSYEQKALEIQKKEPIDNLTDFSELSPIIVLNPKSQNIYEKYGIEFSGNCYDCDLAAISINKKQFDIINVCDKNNFYRIEDFKYESHPNKLVVKTGKNEFIFTKIETAPVYELKILGEPFLLKSKRLSKFYTQKKELAKFKQHDCGEFDG